MSQDTVSCNECGATLGITSQTKFVTCSRCDTTLTVVRTGTSIYTEKNSGGSDIATEPVEKPFSQRRAERSELHRQSEINRIENELNRLDIDWDREKDRYMIAGYGWNQRYGGIRQLPSKGMAMAMGVFGTLFGIFWIVMAVGITSGFTFSFDNEGPGIFSIVRIVFPLFGVIMVIAIIFWSRHIYKKADDYQRAEKKYQQRRNELLDELDEVRRLN